MANIGPSSVCLCFAEVSFVCLSLFFGEPTVTENSDVFLFNYPEISATTREESNGSIDLDI